MSSVDITDLLESVGLLLGTCSRRNFKAHCGAAKCSRKSGNGALNNDVGSVGAGKITRS